MLTPRRYSMDRRRAAVEETRRRIVEATLALHSEKGMFDTSWKDIAERADVSAATVYKHFPSLDELVPACGALIMTITDPPSLGDARGSLAMPGPSGSASGVWSPRCSASTSEESPTWRSAPKSVGSPPSGSGKPG